MDLESAGGLAIHTILSKLGPKDTAAVACVSKRFHFWASDDSHWSRFCVDELALSSPHDPLGIPVKSFKEAYEKWQETYKMYPWSLVKRVKRCWDKLKAFLSINFPEVLATLRKGASEGQIDNLERCLNVKLPIATRLLYRFCDGQELPTAGSQKRNRLGLIGGYSLYDHMVNIFLLPLEQAIVETSYIYHHFQTHPTGRKSVSLVVVASSHTHGEKFFFLNCENTQLYVGSRHLMRNKEMFPCVPESLLIGEPEHDAMLLWLEEHGRRLESGFVKIREEKKVKSICQFPEQAPLCTTAVTNGVQVRASACFVPEFSCYAEFYFSYSIRMSLVPEGCVVNGMRFDSCQLHRRRWLIRSKENVESDVNGEAVIGEYPILQPGEKEYIYQSCTPLSVCPGSVEGSFTFVPGRLVSPKGAPFEVEVARFPLIYPEYKF